MTTGKREMRLKEGAIRAQCPCGQPIVVGYEDDGVGTPVCLHGLPTCSHYDQTEDLADYLHWVNVTLAAGLAAVAALEAAQDPASKDPAKLLN